MLGWMSRIRHSATNLGMYSMLNSVSQAAWIFWSFFSLRCSLYLRMVRPTMVTCNITQNQTDGTLQGQGQASSGCEA